MYTCVFVYLGKSLPDYVVLNINRTKDLFPELNIFLVVDHEHKFKELDKTVQLYFYKKQSKFDSIFDNLSHDKGFRGGFWYLSIERLIAFYELQRIYPGERFLHIEADVILFKGFPFKEIFDLDKLAWSKYSYSRDSAALIYSSNAYQTEWLINQLKVNFDTDSSLTDMTALAKVSNSHKSSVVLLPTVSFHSGHLINRWTSDNLIEDYANRLFLKLENNGIFDPAAIGLWLIGIDPRNDYGFTKIHNMDPIRRDSGYVDPSNSDFYINLEGRLSIKDNFLTEIPIHSLHIHTKNKKYFSLEWEKAINDAVYMSHNRDELNYFSFKIFISLFSKSIRNKSIFRFLINLPKIRNLKKYIKLKK